MANIILSEEEYNELIKTEDMHKRLLDKNERAEAHIKNLKHQLEETQKKMDRDSKLNINVKSKLLTERDELKKSSDSWRERYYEVRYALRKDEQLNNSISCAGDIPSDVEMIEDLKKRAADSDYYKEKSELLEEKLKNANELADSWKRDYERLRDQFIYPIYNILYPDKLDLNINVTDFINNVKDLKVYEDENKSMYEDLKYWRERCHGAETDVTSLNSKVETLKNKNNKLKQTISDQEITIMALLITIKGMCKDDETNE